MTVFSYIIAYLTTAAVFFVLDFIWLGTVARSFYREQLGDLMADPINIPAAAGFYAMYVVGILIFAVVPALKAESLGYALLYGALFGFFAYATYDMTNIATIRDWPVKMSIVDMVWGTALTGFSAAAGYLLTRALT